MREQTATSDSIAITPDIHWVGFAEEQGRLLCNPYLLVDADEAVVFDPGSIPDFPVVMRKIIDTVNPKQVSLIVISHQDPDVCGNLAVVEDVIDREDLRIAGHTNTIRLVQHQGIASEFYAVDRNGHRIQMASGRVLEFHHMPYLHSPGAIATYDPKTRSLFSGDVFGAITKQDSIYAGENFLENMKEFHQAYMPCNALLRAALQRLRSLEIDRILPQHGCVLQGDQVAAAFAYLEELPCGADLIGGE